MLLVAGILAALLESSRSGLGQVVDASMVDGAALLMAAAFGSAAAGRWSDVRGSNMLDGGAPFYRTYETSDRKYLAVGALERRFHEALVRRTGVADELLERRWDVADWPRQRAEMAAVFRTRSRDEWWELLAGEDACVTPVLTMKEAASFAHNTARGTFEEVDGVVQPSPAPRFSRTPASAANAVAGPGADSGAILRELGYDDAAIDAFRSAGVVS
jgi:alpha-methylacyl-CoA racemase